MTKPLTDDAPVRFTTAVRSFPSFPRYAALTASQWGYNDRFLWNKHLLQAAFPDTERRNPWVLPLIYGSADQASSFRLFFHHTHSDITQSNRNKLRRHTHLCHSLWQTVATFCWHPLYEARRHSRCPSPFSIKTTHIIRFKKKSIQGDVANEVETEQIVSENVITPLWVPLGRFDSLPPEPDLSSSMNHSECSASSSSFWRKRVKMNPKYSSFVQLRGSIPVYWTQIAANMQAKPPIHSKYLVYPHHKDACSSHRSVHVVDPYFSAAALHFDDLFARYGTPVIVLNLVKVSSLKSLLE